MKRAREDDEEAGLPPSRSVEQKKCDMLFPPCDLPGELWALVAECGDRLERADDNKMDVGITTFMLSHVCRALFTALKPRRRALEYAPDITTWLIKHHAPKLVAAGLEVGQNTITGCNWVLTFIQPKPHADWLHWTTNNMLVHVWRRMACRYGHVNIMRVIEFELGIGWEPHATPTNNDIVDLLLTAIGKQDVPMLTYFIKDSAIPFQWLGPATGASIIKAILDQPGLIWRLDPISNCFDIFPPRRQSFQYDLIETFSTGGWGSVPLDLPHRPEYPHSRF